MKKACSQHTQVEDCNVPKKDATSHTPDWARGVTHGPSFKKCCSFYLPITATLNC